MNRMGWDDQMRGIRTIDQVHVHPGENGMGLSDERYEEDRGVFSHQVQIVDVLSGKHYEDVSELHNAMVPRPVPNLDDFILGTELSLTSPNHPDSVKGNSATLILTSGATPHLASHRGPFCNSVGMYSSGPEPFPRLVPPSLRSCS